MLKLESTYNNKMTIKKISHMCVSTVITQQELQLWTRDTFQITSQRGITMSKHFIITRYK